MSWTISCLPYHQEHHLAIRGGPICVGVSPSGFFFEHSRSHLTGRLQWTWKITYLIGLRCANSLGTSATRRTRKVSMASDQTLPTWAPAQFYRAVHGGNPVENWGYEWKGLVLRHSGWATPRTKTRWSLIHIGSGGTIMRFTGNVSTIFPVAGEIAECGDFTLFDLPDGWRQTDPDLPAKIGAICASHPEAFPDTSFGTVMSNDDARAVIDARSRHSS